MKRAKLILFILTAVLVLLPMLQQHTGILPFKKLSGVTTEPSRPKFSMKHWKDHSVQNWTENYLKLHYGLREPLTRLHNQYLWDCYDQSNLKENQWVYITDEGWFYEALYVKEYYEGNAEQYSKDSLDMARKLEQEAWRLFQLQHILETFDTHLFVLLIPGKEMIYPEHLPDSTPFQNNKSISAYDHFAEQFNKLNVNYIDVRQWFLQMKDTVDYLLFPQTGTHWSNYTSMLVGDSLIRYMEALGDMEINHYSIGERYPKTVAPDDDLEQLLNLIRPLKKAKNYYAETKIIDNPAAKKPILLTIGDSFYWNLLKHTPFKKIFGETPYWYYYSTVYLDDEHKNVKELDLVKKLMDADFIMVSYSSAQLYKMSDGFSKEALIQLCYDDDEIEGIMEAMVKSIKNHKKWFEGLQRRAEKYNIPLDTALVTEAKNVIRNNPNSYFPALKDSIPTKRSTRVKQYSHGIQ